MTPYVDDFFEEACLITGTMTKPQTELLYDLFEILYVQVNTAFEIEYSNLTSTMHKIQSLMAFCKKTNDVNISILLAVQDYVANVQNITDIVNDLTVQYQDISGQMLNFYDITNTVDFSILTKEMSQKIIFISDMAKTISNESKKSATHMTAIKTEDQSLENLISAINISKRRILAVTRELKGRLVDISRHKNIMASAVYILNKTTTGAITIADLSKMTSQEREVYLNE